MLTIPDHLPVLNLTPSENPQAAELLDKLTALLEADGSMVSRLDDPASATSVPDLITHLVCTDLLLVKGNHVARLPSLSFPPPESSGSQASATSFLCRSSAELASCAAKIQDWLIRCESRVPLAGAVLIGGRSFRMGRPKHLLRHASGETWLERSLATLRPFVDERFISGAGELPAVLRDLARVEDLPGVQGPLAGIGALLRQRPFSSWLVLACDLPNLKAPALDWLLQQRSGRFRAIIARNPSTGRSEPLLAWYDYRSGPLIERIIASGGRRISEVGNNNLTAQPWIPDDLADCWLNVNYPEELSFRGPSGL
jgi:molybdopterin-guanine dinucleotide biosynthesis protein A